MSGWRERLDDVDAALVDGYQTGFPVEQRPFETVGDAVGVPAGEVLDRVADLLEAGIFRRFGPVLNPPVIGSSTLAALAVPEERLDAVADLVNGYRQVNHNYRRAHKWNMWFVVTAGSVARREAILDEIATETGLEPLSLPMRTDYYIDLAFPVVNDDRFAREHLGPEEVEPTRIGDEPAGDLTEREARLLLAVQDGLPLTETPYAEVATDLGVGVDDVLSATERLLDRRAMKRVGLVVNHVRVGFDANCMVVWDVPDDELDERGVAAGRLPYVTLCYHRPRRPERDWPYNLFTMVHGRDPEAVEGRIDDLATGPLAVPHERLHTVETLKQTGARYEELLSVDAPVAAED
jgi:DNA-binding Lrp family transcriptional regulator